MIFLNFVLQNANEPLRNQPLVRASLSICLISFIQSCVFIFFRILSFTSCLLLVRYTGKHTHTHTHTHASGSSVLPESVLRWKRMWQQCVFVTERACWVTWMEETWGISRSKGFQLGHIACPGYMSDTSVCQQYGVLGFFFNILNVEGENVFQEWVSGWGREEC